MQREYNQEVRRIVDNDYQRISMVQDQKGDLLVRKAFFQHNNVSVYESLKVNHHLNVCRIDQVEMTDEGFVVLEEFLGHQTLADILPLSNVDVFFEIVFQLCDGLSFLHGLGIVHRDIKPENIYLVGDRVVINDFDISKPIVNDSLLRKDTQILGTPGFASPEQYGFSRSDERTDIYSLGVVIGNMLVESVQLDRLGKIIEKCTELNPKDRYQSVTELRGELERLSQGQSIYTLPGFRSDKRKNKIKAVIIYGMFLFCLAVVEAEGDTTFYDGVKSRVLFLILSVPLMVIVTNYMNVHNLIPRTLYKIKPLALFVLWGAFFTVSVVIYMLLFGFLDSLLLA